MTPLAVNFFFCNSLMTLLPYTVIALLIFGYNYAASIEDPVVLEMTYRSKSDDSFSQFYEEEEVESEYVVQVPVYEAQLGAPLTIESLSLLNSMEYAQTVGSYSAESSVVGELLQIKRTSSLKSLCEVVSDDSTVNWFTFRTRPLYKSSSYNGFIVSLPITEAPTESNSTSGSSSQTITIPVTLKEILESKLILRNIFGFLEEEDIPNLLETNSLVQKCLNNYGIAVFKELFPSLDGLSDSIVALRILTKLLIEEGLKFKDWNFPNVHSKSNPAAILASFIDYRLETARKPKEIFALVDLMEFVRWSDWHVFFKTLPGPLSLLLPDANFNYFKLNEFKDNILPIIMKAAHYGHLRVFKALKEDIMNVFPETGPILILELFLLNSEIKQGISWTPFQRSVYNQNTKISCFLFYTLTSDNKIIEAFYKSLLSNAATSEESSQMPNFMDRIFFPSVAYQKISKILRRRLLNSPAKQQIRAVHLAVTKAKIPDIVKLFIDWEIEFNGVTDFEAFFSYSLQLAFAAKSLIALRVIRRHFYDAKRIPIEMAIETDWSIGLQEYSQLFHFKNFIYRYINLFHLISTKNAVNVLEYLCTFVFNKEEVRILMEKVDGHSRKPIDVALEAGNSEILGSLQKFGAKINRKFLIEILKTDAKVLNNLIPEQDEKEVFAHHFISMESSVTLLEWSIISGNLQAFNWFLETIPLKYWKRFDGAGNTPIHLSVIVGNSDILLKLLDLDPSLLNIRNFYGETPCHLAHRIRDRTRSKDKQSIINGIIELLLSKS